jgi:hypothetical protein
MPLNILSNFAVKQTGGGRGATIGASLTIFLLTLFVLLIKVILVHYTYNQVVPTLFNQKYRKITITEALFLVILVQSLTN